MQEFWALPVETVKKTKAQDGALERGKNKNKKQRRSQHVREES